MERADNWLRPGACIDSLHVADHDKLVRETGGVVQLCFHMAAPQPVPSEWNIRSWFTIMLSSASSTLFHYSLCWSALWTVSTFPPSAALANRCQASGIIVMSQILPRWSTTFTWSASAGGLSVGIAGLSLPAPVRGRGLPPNRLWLQVKKGKWKLYQSLH